MMIRRARSKPGAPVGLTVLVGALLQVVAPASTPRATADPPRRPNVLIVVADDQRNPDTMGVMPRTHLGNPTRKLEGDTSCRSTWLSSGEEPSGGQFVLSLES